MSSLIRVCTLSHSVQVFLKHYSNILFFSITESLGDNVFEITVTSPTDNRVRVYKQMSDVRDGSYIFRYRLFGTYDTLTIAILYNGKHVAKSPYTLEGTETRYDA